MKILTELGLLTFIVLVSAQIGYSCSCLQITNIEEIKTTDYIFVGKVVEITEDEAYIPPKLDNISPSLQKMIDSRKRYPIKFEVKNKVKGVKQSEITLIKYDQENSPCEGILFEKDKSYLIYAIKDKENGEISDSGLCSRTQNFDKESKDYKELLNLSAKNRVTTKS